MKLSEILAQKQMIIEVAHGCGFNNVRLTRNHAEKLNLVVDSISSESSLGKGALLADCLAVLFKCEIELFNNNQMGTDVVDLNKSTEDIEEGIKKLFRKNSNDIFIEKVQPGKFFPTTQKKIDSILEKSEKRINNPSPDETVIFKASF